MLSPRPRHFARLVETGKCASQWVKNLRLLTQLHHVGTVSIVIAGWRHAKVLMVSAVPILAAAVPFAAVAADTPCGLLDPASDSMTSRDCLACHGRLSHNGHPYDLHYTGTSTLASGLRTLDEAVRRGVFIPDHEVRCVTCHDGNSPWKDHIRLPKGAKPTHAVNLQRRETYENPAALPPPRPGDAVGTKPLCLGCHALD